MAAEDDDLVEPVCTVDELLQLRASELNQIPLLAYPKSSNGPLDYELLTAETLDKFTDAAVNELLSYGVAPMSSIGEKTVALAGPSDLDFIITMFALSRMGYTVMILSPRLSTEAWLALLKTVDCFLIFYATGLDSKTSEIQKHEGFRSMHILKRDDFDSPAVQTAKFELNVDKASARQKVAYIMHSSGSTGLPKPIFQTHGACLQNYAQGYGLRALLTVPLHHTHGHACLFRALYKSSLLYFLNANLPATSANLMSALDYIQPEVVFSVPYLLALMSETHRGLKSLTSCKIVSSTGSQVPDELGDRLVANGVHLVSLWGSTETGVLMNSMRDKTDRDWAYLRIIPSAKPFVLMKQLENNTFELVALDGLKSKVISNSSDPPNSFHSKDIFEAHSSKENRWKYLGRLDDRVTLLNGEKVLPIPIEGRIRDENLVREAIVFGIGRAMPGLLVFRSGAAAELDDEAFINRIWPAVQDANSRSESFSEITKDTILPLGADVEYPMTDKGTFIRPQIYKIFEEQISQVYVMLDRQSEGSLRFDQPEMESYIMKAFRDECSIELPTVNTDFFLAGADSLQVAKMVTYLKKHLYLGNQPEQVAPSTIFEQANTTKLASYLINLSNNTLEAKEDAISTMTEMIEKYSKFVLRVPSGPYQHTGKSMILTGATGSLGIHILAQLIEEGKVDMIYCLVRASSALVAQQRVLKSFLKRGLQIPEKAKECIVCLPSDFSREDLGLQAETLEVMRQRVSCIIHVAWAVNFNFSLSNFEEQHIKGTQNLLNFALSVYSSSPAKFMFCSSISVALRTPPSTPVPETAIGDLRLASSMGYAQSKLVVEHIINNASLSTGMTCRVFRVGQIVGDRRMGIWSESEAIPLIVRSALTLGCLPTLAKSCSWLPVDSVARIVLELGLDDEEIPGLPFPNEDACHFRFYNVVNSHRFSWTEDLLPALREANLDFESITPQPWISRLENGDQNPERNPTIKLLSVYREENNISFSGDVRNGDHGTDDDVNGTIEEVSFDTKEAEKKSETMRQHPDLIKEGLIQKFVANWREKWS